MLNALVSDNGGHSAGKGQCIFSLHLYKDVIFLIIALKMRLLVLGLCKACWSLCLTAPAAVHDPQTLHSYPLILL